MADIITEVSLPSKGLIYSKETKWQNQLKAPRLRDRGLADTSRKFKLQANILDNTLVQPLGMSAYDLHTADFIYLNMRQRQLSKGAAPYRILVKCKNCEKLHKVEVDLSDLPIITLSEKPKTEYKTLSEEVIHYTFVTPRILDEAEINARLFKEEYPEVELSEDSLKTQEFLRLIIQDVDGKKLTKAMMTDFIQSMYIEDTDGLFSEAYKADFGVQFRKEIQCECGKTIVFDVPTGN